jgi:1-phosphofructokinase family hexose kinase
MTGAGAGGDSPPRRLVFVAANPSIDRLYELDRLTVGEIHRPRAVVAVPGGKGLNAARAAARLGGHVTVAGIAAGRTGDWIEEQLARLGIDRRFARSRGETRTCVSIVDHATGAMTEIYERGDAVEPAAWNELERIISEELERGDVAAIALSGSLPPGAPQDGFARIVRLAKRRGTPAGSVPVLVDTYGPALAAVLAEGPAVVKINAAEAREATGVEVTDPGSAAGAAERLLESAVAAVVITLGIAGAVVATAHERAHLVPPDIRGPYPVGSGDAFLGGLAVGIGRGEAIVDAARLGLAAGVANALVPGAGELDPASIAGILGEISVG